MKICGNDEKNDNSNDNGMFIKFYNYKGSRGKMA